MKQSIWGFSSNHSVIVHHDCHVYMLGYRKGQPPTAGGAVLSLPTPAARGQRCREENEIKLVAVLVSDLWAMAGKNGTVFFNNWPPSWMCHSDRTGCWTWVSPHRKEAISLISAQFYHMPGRYERGWERERERERERGGREGERERERERETLQENILT